MSKSTREFRCFSSIVSSRGFIIHGTVVRIVIWRTKSPIGVCIKESMFSLAAISEKIDEQRKGYSSIFLFPSEQFSFVMDHVICYNKVVVQKKSESSQMLRVIGIVFFVTSSHTVNISQSDYGSGGSSCRTFIFGNWEDETDNIMSRTCLQGLKSSKKKIKDDKIQIRFNCLSLE